ncbi:MAG: hypothetical protein SGPRY_010546 [Prymnesium sp.]
MHARALRWEEERQSLASMRAEGWGLAGLASRERVVEAAAKVAMAHDEFERGVGEREEIRAGFEQEVTELQRKVVSGELAAVNARVREEEGRIGDQLRRLGEEEVSALIREMWGDSMRAKEGRSLEGMREVAEELELLATIGSKSCQHLNPGEASELELKEARERTWLCIAEAETQGFQVKPCFAEDYAVRRPPQMSLDQRISGTQSPHVSAQRVRARNMNVRRSIIQ